MTAVAAQRSPRKSEDTPLTVPGIRARKHDGPPLVMVTAYDYTSALLCDQAGVDVVLVGDSLGMTMLGYPDTVAVTLDEMLHHVRAVRRGLKRALLLADLPFGTYQASVEDGIRAAVRLLKEGGAQAVKLEGGQAHLATVRRLAELGIPVFGHLGLTPQTVHALGGFRAQGKTPDDAQRILDDAHALETAGAFGIVLETIPADLATRITASVGIPTVGIGAGAGCDGQVQVWQDVLGLTPGKPFRHVGRYANLSEQVVASLRQYGDDVRTGAFPTKEQSL